MILRYSWLLLGLVAGLQGHEHCNFEKHMCKWHHLYNRCQFSHEKGNSLAGEKGYLYLSKKTCKKAGVYFYVDSLFHRFRLHYLINGTGHGTIAVYAHYSWSGRTYIWSCNLNHGSQWNQADIFVYDEGIIDSLEYIGIEASVKGDMTVAIGNITPDYRGHPQRRCTSPTPIKPKPRKTTTRKPTTKKLTTAKIPQTSRSVNPTTRKIPQTTSRSVNPTTRKIPQTTSRSVNPTTMKIPQKSVIPTTTKSKTTTSHQNPQKKTTSIPAGIVTKRYHPKPTTTTGPRQDLPTPESNESSNFEKLSQSPKSNRGAIIGGSVFAVVFVIAVALIAGFIYKRKIKIWNIHTSTVSGIENPVYS